jgi:hypothetical protein
VDRTASNDQWLSFTIPMVEEPLGRFGATSDRLQIGLCALACKNQPGCEVFSFGKSASDQGKCLWSKGCGYTVVTRPGTTFNALYNTGAPLDAGGLLAYPPYVQRNESWDIYQVSRGQTFPPVVTASSCSTGSRAGSSWSCAQPDQYCPSGVTGSGQGLWSTGIETSYYSGYCCMSSYRTAPSSTSTCARTGAGGCVLPMCHSPGNRPAGHNCREWDSVWTPAVWAQGAVLGLCGERSSWQPPLTTTCPGSSCGGGGKLAGGGFEGQNCVHSYGGRSTLYICRHRVWRRIREVA